MQQALRRGRESPDPAVPSEKKNRYVHAAEDVRQIVTELGQLHVADLGLLVYADLLLVSGLLLLPRPDVAVWRQGQEPVISLQVDQLGNDGTIRRAGGPAARAIAR